MIYWQRDRFSAPRIDAGGRSGYNNKALGARANAAAKAPGQRAKRPRNNGM